MIWTWIVMMVRRRLLGMKGVEVGVDGAALGEVGLGEEAGLVIEEAEVVVEGVDPEVDFQRPGGGWACRSRGVVEWIKIGAREDVAGVGRGGRVSLYNWR